MHNIRGEINITEVLLVIALVLSLVYIGYDFFFDGGTDCRILDGLWLKGFNRTHALEYAYSEDAKGNWVCININGMTWDRIVETCKHETFHEMWAECGEKNNLTYCIEKHDKEINGVDNGCKN